jgi:prepilin-type N-terminal cleavage/methylation domain-containing protein
MGRRISHGFTLIEVLVVVAIIALLVAILIPSLSRARELARRTVCASRLHNLGFATQGYSAANRGKIIQCSVGNYRTPRAPGVPAQGPVGQTALNPRFAGSSEPHEQVDWMFAIQKYTVVQEIWECPNRAEQFTYEGTPEIAVQGYDAAMLRARGYRVTEKPDYDEWGIAYQYFGGIRQWQTPKGNFVSRSPCDSNAKPTWALASDSNIWCGGDPEVMRKVATVEKVPPHLASGLVPAGGNTLTFDAAVAWIPFYRMISIHAWASSGEGGRQGYWWQADLGDYGKWLAQNDPTHASVKEWKPQ